MEENKEKDLVGLVISDKEPSEEYVKVEFYVKEVNGAITLYMKKNTSQDEVI